MKIDRQNVYYFVGLAIFCGLVVFGMVYYGKDRLQVKLTDVCKPVECKTNGQQQTVMDIDSTTLHKMQHSYEEQKTPRPLETPRNPFLWNDEMKPPEIIVKVEKAPEKVPRLGMIIVGPGSRLAFLDEKLVYEGREHGGFRVEKIAPKAVTLSSASGRLQLIAPVDHFGPAEVKREERTRLEKR